MDNQARFAWPVDPQGYHLGFTDLKLCPPDMVKLGTLYLDEGRRQEVLLVPASWIREATAAHMRTRRTAEGYGYQWSVTTVYVAWRPLCVCGGGEPDWLCKIAAVSLNSE